MANCKKCAECEFYEADSRESYPIEDWEDSYRVFALQNMLHYIGIPTSRDGVYGNATKANVKEFQRIYGDRYGLDIDGIPGKQTMAALATECIYKQAK